MNVVRIEDGAVVLNDVKLKDVVEYEVKCSAAGPGTPTAEITLKLLVDPSKLSLNSFAELSVQNERLEIIKLSDEQKAIIAEGLKRLSAEGYPDNVIRKKNHVFNK